MATKLPPVLMEQFIDSRGEERGGGGIKQSGGWTSLKLWTLPMLSVKTEKL